MVTLRALGEMALLGFLVLAFGHYGIPRLLGRKPHRLEAYTLGILFGLWLPVALVTWWEGLSWDYLLVMVIASAGSGVGTALGWALDKVNGRGGIPGLMKDLVNHGEQATERN